MTVRFLFSILLDVVLKNPHLRDFVLVKSSLKGFS